MATISQQEWFKDGLDDAEAAFVLVLYEHSLLDPNDPNSAAGFDTLISQHFIEQRTIELELSGDTRLFGFYLDQSVETGDFWTI